MNTQTKFEIRVDNWSTGEHYRLKWLKMGTTLVEALIEIMASRTVALDVSGKTYSLWAVDGKGRLPYKID